MADIIPVTSSNIYRLTQKQTEDRMKKTESQKKWRLANPERQAQWAIKHPSLVNWCAMKDRCLNSKAHSYKHYGGRGITIYNPWLTFDVYEKDFGYSKPGPGYTVDRIDSEGNYEPGNVRWLTRQENSRH